MHYEEFEPAPELASFVACYLSFTVPAHEPEPINHYVIPDGTVSLVYIRIPYAPLPFFRLIGPRLDALRPPTISGGLYWGIRLQPGVVGPLLHTATILLRDQVSDVVEYAPEFAARIEQCLHPLQTIEEAAHVFDLEIRRLVAQALPLDELVIAGIKALSSSHGQQSVASLARESGLSERQFLRRFRAATGLTPKEFGRIRRLRKTVIEMTTNPQPLVDLAIKGGFTDQPHMIHEFANLIGLPPTSFAERLERYQHGTVMADR